MFVVSAHVASVKYLRELELLAYLGSEGQLKRGGSLKVLPALHDFFPVVNSQIIVEAR